MKQTHKLKFMLLILFAAVTSAARADFTYSLNADGASYTVTGWDSSSLLKNAIIE